MVFIRITEDDLCDNGDEDNWSSFSQNNYNGNLVRSTSYIFLETILEETSDDLRTDSERSSEEGYFLLYKLQISNLSNNCCKYYLQAVNSLIDQINIIYKYYSVYEKY